MSNRARATAAGNEGMGLLALVRHALPHGRTLPDDSWRRRHEALLVLLWAHAAGLFVFGVARGHGVLHSAGDGVLIAAFALLATLAGGRARIAASLVSLGLITSSAVLVHFWDGATEAHFHFFVMIVLLALYEDWRPFLLAAAYVVLHHGVLGALAPDAVYNHGDAVANPWKWAAIHALFVAAAGIGSVVAWRLNEDVRAEARRAYGRARESEERFRSAFENAPIGMALCSIDPADPGRFVQVNRAMCEITGYSADDLLGKRFDDITHPDDRESSTPPIAPLLLGEIPSLHMEKRYVRADDREVSVLISVSLVRNGSGDPLYTIGQVQDVTERKRAQEQLSHQAHHDALTGLPNRRKLIADLARGLASATSEQPLMLALFDLDGFKAYNDAFGHPAGDALLGRLGQSLAAAMAGVGCAYRMGGDEFCVLAPVNIGGAQTLARTAAGAFSERGEGFTITASYGSVVLPLEATDAAEALRTADQRMYGQKRSGRASAGRQATDALLTALSERSPQLGAHLHDVTELCEAVAHRLSVSDEELAPLLQAAALHDVGKVAIPDAILDKPGPLDDAEWHFMRTHTVIGQRILGAAPALSRAAELVRSSHERFDGAGYPDGLAGEDIPLGARIIFVCDAYNAMTSSRPYQSAMSSEEALCELRRHAGTQFDPALVQALAASVAGEEPSVARRLAA